MYAGWIVAALTTPGALAAQPAEPPTPPANPAPAVTPDPGLPETRPDGGQSAENAALDGEITPQLDETVQRGLSALAAIQLPDGSFDAVRYGKNSGITALACLAFMADGNLPGRGRYSRIVERGIDFVLTSANETGLIATDTTHGPMYGHGFAALFLGEVYGMTAGGGDTALSARIYDALVRACRLIVQTQNNEGGWRYNPVPNDADISVTICQIMALRSARNAGLDIPKTTIDRAVAYVRQCQNADGGFQYQLQRGGSAWPRTGAGVASLFYAGVYEDQAIDRGINYLMGNAFPGSARADNTHYFYGHYYSVQAMYLAGGDAWARWWPAIREELIRKQGADGLWDDDHAGKAYGAAMALIVLQMPKRYLPIFQK